MGEVHLAYPNGASSLLNLEGVDGLYDGMSSFADVLVRMRASRLPVRRAISSRNLRTWVS